MSSIGITVLVENTTTSGNPRGEHGLSVWVETEHGAVLWDTGQSGLFLENARTLGIPVETVRHIALSHGHYDHTGGLMDILSFGGSPVIHAHPGILTDRFGAGKGTGGKARPIGIPFPRGRIEEAGGRLALSREREEILPGVFTTGEIPRTTDFEDTGGRFYLDDDLSVPDPITDDQSLVIETGEGLVLLLGCCHAGLVNTLTFVAETWNTRNFALVAGGMHLLNADEERLRKTVSELRRFTIKSLRPGHCTGWRAVCTLASAFPGAAEPISVGWSWRWG